MIGLPQQGHIPFCLFISFSTFIEYTWLNAFVYTRFSQYSLAFESKSWILIPAFIILNLTIGMVSNRRIFLPVSDVNTHFLFSLIDMSKTLTRDEINQKKFRRINDKSLRQLLIHRFINAYGYDKGEVTAKAIVDDILQTIEHYFVIAKPLQLMAEGKTPPDEYYLRYGQSERVQFIRHLTLMGSNDTISR